MMKRNTVAWGLAGIGLLLGVAMSWAVATGAVVRLRYEGVDSEGRQQFELAWDAASNSTYKVQHRRSLNANEPWRTFDVFQSTGTTFKVTLDGDPLKEESHFREVTGFYRLGLPEPEIFSIEPARFPFGGPVELHFVGQCFNTNLQVRVGPLTLTNCSVVNPNLMQCTFVPPAAGTYVFELVASDGTGLSSVPVECFDPLSPPVPVLQEPPDVPWATPSAALLLPVLRKVQEKAGRPNYLRVTPSGELEAEVVDLFIPGVGLDFIWGRKYRSRTGPNSEQGNRWDFSYNVRATQVAGGMEVRDGMGRADVFPQAADGTFGRDEHFCIGTITGGVFRLTFADTGHWEFHPFDGSTTAGRLARIVDRNANTMRLEYDGAGRLARVIDTLDRTNTIAYSALGKISSVTDFSGRSVTYAYYRSGEAGGNDGDLKSATSPPVTGTPNGNDFPAGKTVTYTYSRGFQNPRQNSLLLTVTDARGQTPYRHVYQHNQTDYEFLRCIGRQVGTTNDRLTYAYVPLTPSPSNGFATQKIIVNDRVGNVSEHLYDARHRMLSLREFTGRAVAGLRVSETTNRPAGRLRVDDPDYFETRFEWNNDSLCTRVVHPRGNSTEMVYQRDFNQNSSRSNHTRRHEGNLRVLRALACCGGADTDGDGVPDTEALVWRFEHDARFGTSRMLADVKAIAETLVNLSVKEVKELARLRGDINQLMANDHSFSTLMVDPRGTVSTGSYDANGNLLHTETSERKSGSVILTDREYNERGQMTVLIHPADGEGRRRRDECFYYTNGVQNGYLREHVKDCLATGFHLTNRYEYDARGNLTRHIDPRGFDTLWSYNTLDQCVLRQTPKRDFGTLVRTATFHFYDANDNLVQVDVENRDHTDALDAANPLWSSGTEYDLLDRPVARWHETAHVAQGGPSTKTNRVSYDGNGNVVLAQSAEAVAGRDPNNVVQYQYDERDLPFQTLPAPGTGLAAMDRFDYDANGNCRRVNKIDAFTIKQSVFEYDGFDRRVRVIDAMGNAESFAYDRNGNLVHQRLDGETTDIPGNAGNRRLSETRYEYDGINRVTRFRPAFFDIFTELPIGDGEATTTFTYAPNGQLLSETDDNGRMTLYAYDTLHRPLRVTDPKSNTVTYGYDDNGNVTSLTLIERSDLGGPEQRFALTCEHDGRNRRTRASDNLGNTENWSFDSRDNVVRHIDPNGTLTGWTYDGLSRVTLAIGDLDGDGLLDYAADVGSASTYDDNSRLVSTTDDNGNVTRHAYDAVDRLVATTNADNTVTRLVWSPRSNLTLRQDANGSVISNSYDLLDRCVRRDIAPGPGVAATTTLETFDYDGESRLVRTGTLGTSPAGIEHTFVWNSLSDLGGQSSGGLTLRATHDGVGNRLSSTHPSGRVVQHTYDALDQPVALFTVGAGGLTQHTASAYDGAGRLARIARTNGINTRINWNGQVNPPNSPGDFGWRQVVRVNHARSGGGAVIDQRVAAYDRAQNKILRAQTVPFSTGGPTQTNTFAYDKLHRLTRGTRTLGPVLEQDTQYQLDGNGNRQLVISGGMAAPYLMDTALPEPADFQMNQYSLSPFGAHQYDRNGNLVSTDTGAGPTIYHYDYADRLVFVERTAGPATFLVAAYEYDAMGRRISKTEFPPPPAAPVVTSYFLDADCDGDGIIEERENGALRRSYAFPHVFDQKGRIAFTDTGETLYFHDDELGNVLALTDAGGSVVERYDYDDHGAPSFLDAKGDPLTDATGQPVTSSPAGNPFLFHGMEWDPETGLYLNRRDGRPMLEWTFEKGWPSRYYHPGMGRNTTRTASLDGGMPNRISMNVTARDFAGNNPWSGARRPGRAKWANIVLKRGFADGGGGGSGGLRSHEDVYVWKICSCGKKTCKNGCAGRKKSLLGGGGGGSGGSAEVMFNPKEITIDKSVPWQSSAHGKWKTFRGGGLVLHETAGVTRSLVQDFEKNTEGVSGGFGLMSVSEPLVHTHRWRAKEDVYVWKLKKEEGGRHTPFHNKYRPRFYLRTTDVTGEIELESGREMITGSRGHRDVGGYRYHTWRWRNSYHYYMWSSSKAYR